MPRPWSDEVHFFPLLSPLSLIYQPANKMKYLQSIDEIVYLFHKWGLVVADTEDRSFLSYLILIEHNIYEF